MSIQILSPFFGKLVFFCLFCCWVVAIYFGINPVSHTWFANIFFHSIGCLSSCWFLWLYRRFSSLIQSHLFILDFAAFAFSVKSKISLPRPMSRNLISYFSPSSFTVSGFTFNSSIYFELMFCVWCKTGVPFHPFACGCPVFLTPFIEETILSLLSLLGVFVKN